MNPSLTPLAHALVLAALGPPAASQATALLRQGDVLPGGLTVTRIKGVGTNGVGGYATMALATDGSDTVSLAWGSPDGSPPGVLFQEGTYGGLAQESWDQAVDLDDLGRVVYSARIGPPTATQADSVWIDDQLVEYAPPSSGNQLVAPGITHDGSPWYRDVPFTLHFGLPPVKLYGGGDVLPDTNGPINTVLKAAFSSRASHHAMVHTVVLDGKAEDTVTLDGAGLLVDGGTSLVTTTNVVPPAIGGTGTEVWFSFTSVAVDEAGDWALTANSTDPSQPITGASAFVVRNGSIEYRLGDVVDGFDTQGAFPLLVRLGDDGRLLHGWRSLLVSDALFVEDRLVAASGDPVDLDGDGAADPGVTLGRIWIDLAIRADLGADGLVYFRAEVDVNGTATASDDVECLLRVPATPPPAAYCTPKPSSSGCAAAMRTSDPASAPVSGAADYSVLCTTVEGARNGLLFWGAGGPAALPFLGGTLCVQPPLNRTPVQSSGGQPGTCTGSFALLLNDGVSAWDLGPGATAWWQAWYRDPLLGDGFDVALSNGIEIDFE